MDKHTKTQIQKMTSIAHNKAEDISKVGQKLQDELTALIQGCTMEGEDHDQLHVFLNLYIPAIEDLTTIGNKKNLDIAKDLLQQFPKFFN